MKAEIRIASLPIFKCSNCGHEWIARVETPKACPACKSYDWYKEETKKES